MNTKRTVAILGAPLDLGAGRRGTDMGPSAIRIAGLGAALQDIGLEVRDLGHVAVPAPETRAYGDRNLRFGSVIAHACTRLRDRVRAILREGMLPLVLGGDHSVAMGTVAGLSCHLRDRDEACGLLWIDAHADINTPRTSPSGNVHGMPLATILGQGAPLLTGIAPFTPMIEPRHAALLGLRDVDAGERKLLRRLGVAAYTMKEIDQRGISTCMKEALARVTAGTAGFHLSFDLDALDPDEAPGVGTPVPGGLTYREAHLSCEMACETGRLLAAEFVEVNPVLDVSNRTGQLAVELIASAMGKTIV